MKLELPQFANDAEEANWWFDHQDEIAERYQREHPEQFLSGTAEFVAADVTGEDAHLLRKRAAALGVDPHTYALKLIHDALHEQKAA